MRWRSDRFKDNDESGLTLVEMVVSLFLITMVLTSFVSLAIASSTASRAAEVRARANEVGNQEVERIKGLAWTDLGLYDSDTSLAGASATSVCGSSESIISLGSTPPSPRVAPALQSTQVVDGKTYTVTDCITWRDDPADGLQSSGTETDSDLGHDIKHVAITVSWTLLSKTRTLTFDSLRSPTTAEVPVVSHTTATLALTAAAPSPVTEQLATDYSLTSAMTLTATASVPASAVNVTYTGRAGGVTGNLTSTDGGTTWTLVIPAGATGGTFNAGNLVFTFHGTSASGSAAATSTATLTAPPTPFTVIASASPTSVTLTSGGYLGSAVTLTATTSLVATSVTASIPTAAGSISRSLTSANGGTTWTYTLPADSTNGPYTATSNELITFTATGSSGSVTATQSITLVAYSPPSVIIQSVAVEEYGGRICVKNGQGTTFGAQVVDIVVDNITVSDAITVFSWTSPNTSLSPISQTATASPTVSGRVTFKVTIPASKTFSAASTTFTITAKRTSTDQISATSSPTVTVESQPQSSKC